MSNSTELAGAALAVVVVSVRRRSAVSEEGAAEEEEGASVVGGGVGRGSSERIARSLSFTLRVFMKTWTRSEVTSIGVRWGTSEASVRVRRGGECCCCCCCCSTE